MLIFTVRAVWKKLL